mmetsp:Transcript_56544/g.156421  ORF Transcript_56544/g.156421 Transcript_56544/m.156421 type:complete len:208 (+) Transcript_56544:170-793(+)
MGMGTPWTPSSFADGLILALVSLACWGSWSNTAKDISKPFNDFYYDYTLGLLCLSLVAYATLGHAVFLAETGDGKGSATRVVAAWLAGALFNLANVLLIEGIRMAGLSVAFPVGIGLALVLGTLLTYFADGGAASTQSPAMLFAGVMFAFFAILAQERVGLLAGLCMSCKLHADAHGSWHPLTNIPSGAGQRDEGHVREASRHSDQR